MKKLASITLVVLLLLSNFVMSTAYAAADSVGVSYESHVQNIGWQAPVSDGQTAGTSGQSLRMEALKINLTNAPAGAGIRYESHVSNIGWQSAVSNGQITGTVGLSQQMEAIKITLVNMPGYSVQYQVHVANIGWQPWVSDGQMAGTTGRSLKIEAIRIALVKISVNSGVSIQYQGQVQNIGWQDPVFDGQLAGTEGQRLRMEALKIKFLNAPAGSGIQYRAHISGIGWQNSVSDGQTAGTVGQSRQMEAIEITLVNMPGYSVQYQAHVANIGWQPWVSDGQMAGTTGRSLQIEAIRIRIVRNSLYSMAESAVITAESSKLQTDVDIAQALVAQLTSGSEKNALQARIDIVQAIIDLTAPAVTNDDTANTVTGMTTAMEYNLDGAGYAAYDAVTFAALDFSGDHTLLVRVASTGSIPAGPAVTLTFTTNPVTPAAPPVTNDDAANTVTGMTTAMEYNLDGAGYVAYDAVTFAALDFSGVHTLLVRVASAGINPAGLAATLTFTANPAPAAPLVTRNDVTDTVTGMTAEMEYNYDGTGYVLYDPFDIAWASLNLHGEHTLLVRYAAVGGTPASLVTTLTFTTAPGPAVTRNDVANTVTGMTTAMEYNLDNAGYVAYDAVTFAALDFSGDHTLLVRYAADLFLGYPPSLDTTLTFTTNPGPPVTRNDVTDTVSGMTTAMEYNYDGTGYVLYDQFGFAFASLNLHGEHTLLVRYVGGTPLNGVTTLIFTTAPGPAVTNDDTTNTVTGMTTAMEYNLDGAGYVSYNAVAFAALNFSGDHTLLVRYAADMFMGYPPSLDTTLTFTTNPGPAVTNDDVANTVTGMTTAMEYNLDSAGYVAYNAVTFAALDFSGNHTLLVRVASVGGNPAGPAATLIFTTNPVAPSAPPVTRNDVTDTVSGMTAAMEYNYDATGYVLYNPFDFAFASLNLHGEHTLLVRYAAVGATPASLVTTLLFTSAPGPAVTNDDTANTVTGMTTAMEYNLDGAGYVSYNAVAFAALNFSGDHTLLVRFAADMFMGYPPSLDTTLTFTTNPGPAVTNDDVANTVTGMTTAMEYNLDGAGYVAYDAVTFAALDFSGNHTLLVRVAPDGPAATLIFTTNPVAPAAPAVTRNDVTDTVSGMTDAMEYNYDATGYVMYDPFDIAFASLNLHGEHTLLVRYAAVGATPASLVTTLLFTSAPGPAVTNDDTANTVTGMTTAMEYNLDDAGYVTYDAITFAALDFSGDHTLLVRYTADMFMGYPPSLDTTLTFTTN